MRFDVPLELAGLAPYLDQFFALVDKERWLKRVNQLWTEACTSQYLHKIVSDYHWLEFALSHQWEVHQSEGRLVGSELGALDDAALHFAATVVELHRRLSRRAQEVLEGRLLDALKAQTGFAPLYSELTLARLLMAGGYNVTFPDLEGTANFDLAIADGGFEAEIECKSISVDAGRQIHRKDFYRFVSEAHALLAEARQFERRELILVTVAQRLDPNEQSRALLLSALRELLGSTREKSSVGAFILERRPYADWIPEITSGIHQQDLEQRLKSALGNETHVAGAASNSGGYLFAVRSNRMDDVSAPLLTAMRKAASQLTATKPGFIAIQEHGIDALDLLSPHNIRRMTVLTSALFEHYRCSHVTSVLVTVMGSAGKWQGETGIPVVAFPNRQPMFQLDPPRVTLLPEFRREDFHEALTTPPFRLRPTII